MPFAFLGQTIPVPSLRTYTVISISLIALAMYYSYDTAIEFRDSIEKKANKSISPSDLPFVNQRWPIDKSKNTSDLSGEEKSLEDDGKDLNNTGIVLKGESLSVDMALVLLQEGWCTIIVINMCYCMLLLLGKCLQVVFFGKLRVSERQQIKEKVMNFIFYKFIFVFGVLNVQRAEDVVLWIVWFSVLLFLTVFCLLCRERFDYLASSPTTRLRLHLKVLLLLSCIFLLSLSMIYAAYYLGSATDWNTLAFLAAEALLLFCKCTLGLVKYGIHLYDTFGASVWERRHSANYYADFILEMAYSLIDFLHHFHMLFWGNVFLSMASLVIFMQIRYLFSEILRRWNRHSNYMRVVRSIDSKFPIVTDIDESDCQCAICWDKMESARKLPCKHLFHRTCLGLWLEQDTSCPTCRLSIIDESARNNTNAAPEVAGSRLFSFDFMNSGANHAFRFDGSRYISWLPSLSVEVTHTHMRGPVLRRGNVNRPRYSSHLQNMARQVMTIFPDSDINAVLEDLSETHSMETTVGNIVEGRLRMNSSSPEEEHLEQTMLTEESEDKPSDTVNDTVEVSEPVDQQVPSTSLYSEPKVETPTCGHRFSKSASERQEILRRNKMVMLEKARRNYMQKLGQRVSTSTEGLIKRK
ncbi:DgyrCDS2728 [Dimorphilus gyrociliatus]|uniref:DgyrCDS2728 n=1 Tax=Dimorphilus gyrociliatus TaxID=2664684 RepID=A0A7I8VCX4_9ANNE|nr:DgyrCDS2728 [Dimorphilus gyrociliatus]